MHDIRQLWSTRKSFRILLIAAVIYALLRFLIQVVYLSGALIASDQTELATPADLSVYIDAAQRIVSHAPLYLDPSTGVKTAFPYLYSPTFSLLFGWVFLWLTPTPMAFVHTLLHVLAYLALYLLWRRMCQKTKLPHVTRMLVWTLPLWLIYAPFWSDMLLLNVRVFITLIVVGLIESLLSGRLARSVVLLTLLLLLKPQWACVAVLPLLIGQRQFFLKLLAFSAAAYLVTAGLTIMALEPEYGIQQYSDYARVLAHVNDIFPWRTVNDGVLGANHSITQLVVFFLGITPGAFRLAGLARLLLLLPLIVLALRYLRNRPGWLARRDTAAGLELALALCLGSYIALDLVWADDFFLGIVILPYLLAVLPTNRMHWVWPLFIPYALVDFLRLVGYAALGTGVMITSPYLDLARTDPSVYIPLALVLILACYVPLLWCLWMREGVVHSPAASELSELRP